MFDRTRQGAVDILAARDPLNADNAAELNAAVEDALRQGQPRIVLDLNRVPFINSDGLEWLLDVQERCRRRGGALKLASPTPLCRDVLHVTGVVEQFEVYDEPIRAVGSFAQ